MDILLLQAIVLYPEGNENSRSTDSVIVASTNANWIIQLSHRGYLYVATRFPLLAGEDRCFRINATGRIQFVYESNSEGHAACSKHRIKCRNGGQCQARSTGETICLCLPNTTGPNCEYVGIRCHTRLCLNQALCSLEHESCDCAWGSQGHDCSIKCGESYHQPNISSDRIINGEEAVKNSWPYLVYIQIGEESWCGGSLIDPWTVLTAAHCTEERDLDEFVLWFGVHRLDELQIELEMGIVERRTIRQIIAHPNYQTHPFKDYQNDLALLRLDRPIQETLFIRYLCLLPADHRIPDVQQGDRGEIVGWGLINRYLPDGTYLRRTNVLQQATVEILPDDDCLEYQRYDRSLFYSPLMICAGAKDYRTDSCQGDSGGPLLMKYHDRWFAVGIVSFGSVECAKYGAAGVYTRLSVYSQWIFEQLRW